MSLSQIKSGLTPYILTPKLKESSNSENTTPCYHAASTKPPLVGPSHIASPETPKPYETNEIPHSHLVSSRRVEKIFAKKKESESLEPRDSSGKRRLCTSAWNAAALHEASGFKLFCITARVVRSGVWPLSPKLLSLMLGRIGLRKLALSDHANSALLGFRGLRFEPKLQIELLFREAFLRKLHIDKIT